MEHTKRVYHIPVPAGITILIGILLLVNPVTLAQNNRVFNLVEGDSVNIWVEARGEIQWDQSDDSISWSVIPGKSGPTLAIHAEKNAYYRARIIEPNCDQIYSDISKVRVIPTDTRKNIVFIFIDDMGWRDLVCYGSDFYETPNIDKLAKEGIRFTEAYSAHPVCSPTRSSIATGKYPARLHVSSYIPGPERDYALLSHPADWTKYLKMAETTYAEVLRDHGYKTFHSGKWHLGQLSPMYHGFDELDPNLGHSAGTDDPKNDLKYSQSAIEFIEENRDSLFLAVISHNTVHVPLETRQDLEDKYTEKEPGSFGQNNAVMAGMIESLDHSVGMVMNKLEELHLLEKTYIIFFSDNGGLANATSNRPLRGGKSQLYEGGIRVPFIVKGPRLPRNHLVSYPVISNDIFPTMLSMAGIELMPEKHMDGISLMPLLTGEKTELSRENLFFHYPHYQILPPHSAVRSGSWKLIEHYEDGAVELFDLSNDLGETNNLAGALTGKKEEMLQLLHDHLDEIGAQLPTPNPNYNPAREKEQHNGAMDPEELLQPEYLNWNK